MPTEDEYEELMEMMETADTKTTVVSTLVDGGHRGTAVFTDRGGAGVPAVLASIIQYHTTKTDATTEETLREVVEYLNRAPSEPDKPMPIVDVVDDE